MKREYTKPAVSFVGAVSEVTQATSSGSSLDGDFSVDTPLAIILASGLS